MIIITMTICINNLYRKSIVAFRGPSHLRWNQLGFISNKSTKYKMGEELGKMMAIRKGKESVNKERKELMLEKKEKEETCNM